MAAYTADRIYIESGQQQVIIVSNEVPKEINKGDFLVVNLVGALPVEINRTYTNEIEQEVIELINSWPYNTVSNVPCVVIPSTVRFRTVLSVLQEANQLFNRNVQAMYDWQTQQGEVTFKTLNDDVITVKTLPTIIEDVLSLELEHSDLHNLNSPGGHDFIYRRTFNNVSDMLDYTEHTLGNKYTTGETTWKVTNSYTPLGTNNGLYLRAIGNVHIEDFIPEIENLWPYDTAIIVPTGLIQYEVFAGSSRNEKIEVGKTYTVKYTISKSTSGSEDLRIRIGGDTRQVSSGSGEYDVTATSQRCVIDTARGDDGSSGAAITLTITEKVLYGEVVKQANDYCRHETTRNRLVFLKIPNIFLMKTIVLKYSLREAAGIVGVFVS